MPLDIGGFTITSDVDNSENQIVRSGLVLLLDAGLYDSYPRTGTGWFDVSGNGHLGVNSNMTYSSSAGGSFSFNDSSSVSVIPNSTALNPTNVSIEAWAKFTGNSNDFIFEKGNVNTQYSLFSHGSDIVFRTKHVGDTGYITTSTTKTNAGIVNGTWHHIVGSFNGSVKKLYVDDTEVVSASKTGNLVTTTPGAAVGRFGGTSSGYFFGGSIAKVAVYNRGLTASEVSQNFEALRTRFGV